MTSADPNYKPGNHREQIAEGRQTNVMLSRVAASLYWMSRYLERSEHVARAVDVTFQLDLDLHGVLADPVELEWNALLSLLRMPPPEPRPGSTAAAGRLIRVEPGTLPTSTRARWVGWC